MAQHTVLTTTQFDNWWKTLNAKEQAAIIRAIKELEAKGPTTGRPTVDKIKASRHHNMKELRAKQGNAHLRVLFAFDPNRQAILLIGGTKTGQWEKWYKKAIPLADNIFDEHLRSLE